MSNMGFHLSELEDMESNFQQNNQLQPNANTAQQQQPQLGQPQPAIGGGQAVPA
jgi:hypothetical protein